MSKIKYIFLFIVMSLNMFSNNYSIVFVHIGKNIPSYLKTSIDQAVLFNPEASVYVIANKVPLEEFSKNFENKNIHFEACEDLLISLDHKKFLRLTKLDTTFLDGFWLYTTERFFYIDELMSKYKLNDVFHLESDNMLYVNLTELLNQFRSNYQGIAATFDNEERAIAGFIYFSSTRAIRDFVQFVSLNVKDKKTDMYLIADYKKKKGIDAIGNLPIITEEYAQVNNLISINNHKADNPQHFTNNIDKFDSIFDAASIGQYLGGNHSIHKNAKARFINDNCVFDPRFVDFIWEKNDKNLNVPYMKYKNKKVRINNLHVHSKNLEEFSSLTEKENVFRKIYKNSSQNILQLNPNYRIPDSKFITGDAYRNHADFIFDETNQVLDPRKVERGSVIFVKTDMLAEFFKKYHKKIENPYILVTHNSDDEVPGIFENYLNDYKIIAWFSQNVVKSHKKLIPIPIGIDNLYWGKKKLKALNHIIKKGVKRNKKYLLYQNFVDKTSLYERSYVRKIFLAKKFCKTSKDLTYKKYFSEITDSFFILSPRGNGIDCHRTWESMYLGSIPIVKSSAMDSLFKDLPILIVNDWNEITEEFLKGKYKELSMKKFNIEKIYVQYWLNLIDSYKKRSKSSSGFFRKP